MRIYTKRGDDGTTGLLHGGRVAKSDPAVEAYGTVDEAQAFLGLARCEAGAGSEVDEMLVGVERDLWVLMADLATGEDNRDKLEPGRTQVTDEMVRRLEGHIDSLAARAPLPKEFAVPGQTPTGSRLDVARTVVRRAERRAVEVCPPTSLVIAYLNRLSDLLWAMARADEAGDFLAARQVPPSGNNA
ncbi:MAG TPA: cob(I)yrinic acid a,c-diamide adenosyltransferase [Acidimicrobiales bacterium]|nr:cob(I)yrinic acid a,c-diamide adenosyltransferase [Acidimicrobiales bacterium]